MKKLFLFAFAAMTASILISSCKKSDPVSIVGRWNIVDQIYTSNGISDTTIATQGDYADFRSDGKLIIGNNVAPTDTSTYSVSNNTLYLTYSGGIGGDTLQIQSLTLNSLKLYQVDANANASWIINMSR
jgi:hypothetical protein